MIKLTSIPSSFNKLVYWDHRNNTIKNRNIFSQIFHRTVNIFSPKHFENELKHSVEKSVKNSLAFIARVENLLLYPRVREQLDQVTSDVERTLWLNTQTVDADYATSLSVSIYRVFHRENAQATSHWENPNW